MVCIFCFARCINIIFNSLLAQLVKYDVHTARKIKFIHAIIYHILLLSGYQRSQLSSVMQSSPRSQSPCPSPSPYGLSPSPRLRVLKSDSSRTGVHYGLEYYITGCRQRSINEVYRVHQNCTLIYKALLCIVTEREVRQSGEQKDKRIILL